MPVSGSNKRPGEDHYDGGRGDSSGESHINKLPRAELEHEGVHTGGPGHRKKIASASRTGQACDRCKVRKIRCDARPGGCSPCLQNNTECKTTDRITGRATSRGHTENLEHENASLKSYVLALQQQLRESGLEPKQPSSAQAFSQTWPQNPPKPSWDQSQGANAPPASDLESQLDQQGFQGTALPDFLAGRMGDNFLGISSNKKGLGAIEGTSLSFFGTKIDLAEFTLSEDDPANASVSYATFYDLAFRREKQPDPGLPSYEQCKVYADWYFRSIQRFTPVLHRPDFLRLLDRIHLEQYTPTPAESTMVHMVLCMLNFQFHSRNFNEQARQDCLRHFHYAIGFIPELVAGHTLEDIQALTLICLQLRAQPRPGPAWMFSNMVFGLALELGLHRSAKAWHGSTLDDQPHRQEMRKRVFWSLLLFTVQVSGKLGRPMPLRVEDFDVEIPKATHDYPDAEDDDGSDWKKCTFRAAIESFKLLPVMMRVYSSIYSIRSTGQYEECVRTLERSLDRFQSQIPPKLQGGEQTKDEDRFSAPFITLQVAQCQLLLHHPALCRSRSPKLMSRNLDVCLEWSTKLLAAATELKTLKSLDTTWFFSTDFLAAIFTTLFAAHERKSKFAKPAAMQQLREDMEQWLDVLGEVGNLFGTGHRLQNAIRSIIERSLTDIGRGAVHTPPSASVPDRTVEEEPALEPQQVFSKYENTFSTGDENQTTGGPSTKSFVENTAPQAQQQQTSQLPPQPPQHYEPSTPFVYQDPQSHTLPTYQTFPVPAYSTTEDTKPTLETPLSTSLPHHPPTHPFTMAACQSPTPSRISVHGQSPTSADVLSPTPPGLASQNLGPAAWRHFADAMMHNIAVTQPHEASYNIGGDGGGGGLAGANTSTNNIALPQKSPHPPPQQQQQHPPPQDMVALAAGHVAALGGGMQMPQLDLASQPWPLLHYHAGPGMMGTTPGQGHVPTSHPMGSPHGV